MSLPKAPVMSPEQISRWETTAPKDICDPEFLRNCCQRFNTAEMPISSAEEFYDIAINLVKVSKNRDDFIRRLKQINSQRRADLTEWRTKLLQNARSENCEPFPRGIACDKVFEFCRNPSLETLQPILNGLVHGWEAEECVVDGAPIEPLSNDDLDISSTQFWNENDLPHGHTTSSDTSNDSYGANGHMSRAPSEASEASRIESFDEWCQKRTSRYEQNTRKENPRKKRRRFDDATGADDAGQSNNKYKRRRLTEEVIGETEARDHRIKKRAGDHDDDNDGLGHKCKKIKTWTCTSSDFPTSATGLDDASTDNEQESLSTASEKGVVENIHWEKSKTDDGENDKMEPRHKRRKTETRASAPTLHMTQQTTDESMTLTNANIDDEVKGSQSESRRRTSSGPVLHEQKTLVPTGTLKTRSMTRDKSSAFWELVGTSNYHLI